MGSVSTIYNGVRTWLAGRALMDVAFSDRSTNGLQNKIITAKKNEIEGRLDDIEDNLEANNKHSEVDISSYTSGSNPYIFERDGYVEIGSEQKSSGNVRVVINGANNSLVTHLYMNITGNYQVDSLFVRKGMRCWIASQESGTIVKFIGLTN